jgi:hypothetical protein
MALSSLQRFTFIYVYVYVCIYLSILTGSRSSNYEVGNATPDFKCDKYLQTYDEQKWFECFLEVD